MGSSLTKKEQLKTKRAEKQCPHIAVFTRIHQNELKQICL